MRNLRYSCIYLVLSLPLWMAATSCNKKETTNERMKVTPPIARIKPDTLVLHNDTRIDNYFWMRLSDEQKNSETKDAQTQEVVDYLNAENDYLEKSLGHTKAFQDSLFMEIKSRIKRERRVCSLSVGWILVLRSIRRRSGISHLLP